MSASACQLHEPGGMIIPPGSGSTRLLQLPTVLAKRFPRSQYSTAVPPLRLPGLSIYCPLPARLFSWLKAPAARRGRSPAPRKTRSIRNPPADDAAGSAVAKCGPHCRGCLGLRGALACILYYNVLRSPAIFRSPAHRATRRARRGRRRRSRSCGGTSKTSGRASRRRVGRPRRP